MAPLTKELSQGFRRIWSIKLLVTLVGVACLGIALLVITPSYAAAGSNAAKLKTSGGGCTSLSPSKVCVNAKNGKAVSSASIKGSPCPKSVEIKLFDNNGLVASTTESGCGNFKGPTAPLKSGNGYTAQVIIDGSAVPSPTLTVS